MGKKSKGKKRARKTVLLGKLLALLPASCILLYPLYLAAQLDSVEEDYVNPALPGAFEGLRLAFVSDIHYGALLGEDRVRALVRRVNAWQPDVILLGGDYGEDSDGALAFWRLRPGFQAKICVAATVGNHDRTLPESNLEKIKEAMRANDVIPTDRGRRWPWPAPTIFITDALICPESPRCTPGRTSPSFFPTIPISWRRWMTFPAVLFISWPCAAIRMGDRWPCSAMPSIPPVSTATATSPDGIGRTERIFWSATAWAHPCCRCGWAPGRRSIC